MTGESPAVWHILEASSVPATEFGSALNRFVPTIAWIPQISWLGFWHGGSKHESIGIPPMPVIYFPLPRGYSRPGIAKALGIRERIRRMLASESSNPSLSPLVCTTPFFAPVAELWPGPVIYYSLDFTCAYEGLDAAEVLELERQLCRAAHLVCPVSHRIAVHLTEQAGCAPAKINVLPNAARTRNLRTSVSETADDLPSDVAGLKRPIAGIIGNMADNLDWNLLYEAIRRTSRISWLFVGPTSMRIRDRFQSRMRDEVMALGARVRFLGARPYGELHKYARAIDVAVMPYRRKEPTYSGSATRFYEHLAACRPILSTRGVAELEEKEPLLRLVDGPEQLAQEFRRLEDLSFQDGLAHARWQESQKETWEHRARSMMTALQCAVSTHSKATAEDTQATYLA